MTGLALGTALLLAAPDTVDAPCPGGDVVTRADLEAAGATALHDALRLSPVLDGLTVDGFDRQPLAPWGFPFDTPVRVFVEGAPTAGSTSLEPDGLEFLPVALGEVERIVICPGPGVAGGVFGGAWIDVRTAPPAPTAFGAISYGNETGDPGPDRYLRPDLPNVDHWGPDFEAAVVARPGPAETWASLRDRGFFPTDSALAPRVFEAVDGVFPARSGTALALAARTSGLNVRVGGTRARDLPYLPEAAREIPVSRRSIGATASVLSNVSAPLAVRGHVHAARLTLDRPAWSALPTDPDWAETRVDAAVSARRRRPGSDVSAGLGLTHTAATGPGLQDAEATVGRVWGRIDRRRPGTRQSLTVQGSASESGTALSAALIAWRAIGPRASLRLTLAADETLSEATPNAAFWIARGYTGLATPSIILDLDAPRPTRRLLARLAAQGRAGRLRWSASVEGQRVLGDVLQSRLTSTATAPAGRIRSRHAEGDVIRGTLSAQWTRGPISLQASGTTGEVVGGNAAFRETWRRVPHAAGSLQATMRPDTRLALWTRLAARAGTTWTGFPDPDVPATALLDLGLSKNAWGDRLRISLSGRNVLGAREQTHPLGATLAPRLLVRLDARL